MNLLNLLFTAIVDPDITPIKIGGAPAGDNQIQDIINFIFMLAGALALLFVVIGGLRYILSRGEPEGVARAKNTVVYALVGLLITITAYGIVTFVLNQL